MKIAPTTTMIMVWSIAAMVLTGFSASQAKADPPGQRHSHEGLTWPPQPRDITNVVVRSNIKQEEKGRALRKNRSDRLEAKAKRKQDPKGEPKPKPDPVNPADLPRADKNDFL